MRPQGKGLSPMPLCHVTLNLCLTIHKVIGFTLFTNGSFKINFYWSRIALQYCINFYCVAKWINCMYTYILSFLDFLHIPQSTEYGAPCAICRFSLFISYIVSVVYICQSQSSSSSQCLSFWYSFVWSLHWYLCFCFANKIIHTIF